MYRLVFRYCWGLLILLCSALPQQVFATPVTLFESLAGNYDYQITGGTLRDGTNCGIVGSGTDTGVLAGIPGTATVQTAYLYWAGSGGTAGTPDYTVALDGNPVTAPVARQYSETNSGRTWFAGAADVTSVINNKLGGPNGTYTFSGLTVTTTGAHCTVATVLAGWGLVVVYEDTANEPLRVINIFEGLQNFWGTSILLTPSNFVIPGSSIDGKFGVLTWEGDSGLATSRNGLFEEVRINGSTLTDIANPINNQYNSTINVLGTATTEYGVDFDVYDISPYLNPGDTSIASFYSSGQDRVLLSLEVISVTNTPVTDLAITKSHSGNFVVDQQGTYTISVTNNGPSDLIADDEVTVSDTLPAGLTYVSATGTGWSCGAVLQVVTCTRTGALIATNSFPDITLTVTAASAASPSVTNTASVSITNSPTQSAFDNQSSNDSSSDLTTVITPDLSTSTKSYVDLNGGDADPGDTIRYTITLTESAGGQTDGVRVTDDIPALVNSFTVVSIPGGATDSSIIGGGANGTGFLDITGISVPASGSATIVFDVTIDGTANPGDTIDNSATIIDTTSGGGTATASTITVSASSIPSTGTKQLYAYFNEAPAPDTDTLQRTPPVVNSRSPWLDANGATSVQTMSPATQASLELGAGNIQIPLCIRRNNPGTNRDVTVTLDYFGGSTGTIGSDVQTNILGGTAWQIVNFNINLAADLTLNPNTTLRMTVTNATVAAANRRVRLRTIGSCGINSRVELNANTVINVDSVDAYDTAYAAGSIQPTYAPGDTIFARAVVSDPFGSFDITGATIEIIDSLGATAQTTVAMTEVNDSGLDTKTYEFQYTIPLAADVGAWTMNVIATEGTEGLVTDLGVGTFTVAVPTPTLSIMKLVSTISDPVNVTNPKAIPGAIVEYQIIVTNTGSGTPDSGTIEIDDPLPAGLTLFLDVAPNAPYTFSYTGTPGSLTCPFVNLSDITDCIEFSDDGGTTLITPTADPSGFDITVPNPVNFIRIKPQGLLEAGGSNPSFTIRFRGRID